MSILREVSIHDNTKLKSVRNSLNSEKVCKAKLKREAEGKTQKYVIKAELLRLGFAL